MGTLGSDITIYLERRATIIFMEDNAMYIVGAGYLKLYQSIAAKGAFWANQKP